MSGTNTAISLQLVRKWCKSSQEKSVDDLVVSVTA